jgi:hypothetical protein
MASRRKLNHFTEEELEELLHAPATTGLRNVLSFGRTPPPDDIAAPGDDTSPGVVPSSDDLTAAEGVASSGDQPSPGVAIAPEEAAAPPPSPETLSSPGDDRPSDVATTPDEVTTSADGRSPADEIQIARGRVRPRTGLVFRTPGGQTVDALRVQRASTVQHGHSPTEQLLYQILFDQGSGSGGAAYRETQIGYDRLSRQSGITKRNIIPIMHRLQEKLAIEMVQEQDSSHSVARRYRVYAAGEILERRRRAGMQFVVRHKGVDFVFPASAD